MDREIVDRFYYLTECMRKKMLNHVTIGGISKGEFTMLQFIELCGSEQSEVTTAILSEKLHISKPAVSQMINTLEQKHYVTREINKNDRRLIIISLTEAGMQTLREEKNKFMSRMNAALDKMGKHDSEVFVGLLEKYFKAMKDLAEE